MRRVVEFFAFFANVGIVLGFVVAATLVGEYEIAVKLPMYFIMAVSVVVLAAGHMLLIRREHDEKAPFWLVSISNALAALALAVVMVFIVSVLRYVFPDLIRIEWLAAAVYGSLGAATAGLAFGAFAFVVGMRLRIMRLPVYSSPLASLRAFFRKIIR